MQYAPCVIAISYVDVLLIFGTEIGNVEDVKRNIAKNLPPKDMGIAKDFLYMAFERSRGSFRLEQKNTVTSLLAEMNMSNWRPVATPATQLLT